MQIWWDEESYHSVKKIHKIIRIKGQIGSTGNIHSSNRAWKRSYPSNGSSTGVAQERTAAAWVQLRACRCKDSTEGRDVATSGKALLRKSKQGEALGGAVAADVSVCGRHEEGCLAFGKEPKSFKFRHFEGEVLKKKKNSIIIIKNAFLLENRLHACSCACWTRAALWMQDARRTRWEMFASNKHLQDVKLMFSAN